MQNKMQQDLSMRIPVFSEFDWRKLADIQSSVLLDS